MGRCACHAWKLWCVCDSLGGRRDGTSPNKQSTNGSQEGTQRFCSCCRKAAGCCFCSGRHHVAPVATLQSVTRIEVEVDNHNLKKPTIHEGFKIWTWRSVRFRRLLDDATDAGCPTPVNGSAGIVEAAVGVLASGDLSSCAAVDWMNRAVYL